MAHLVPRRLCMVAAATIFWMTSSHLQPRIWSTISGGNWMMLVRHSAQIQEASRQWKKAFKSLNRHCEIGLSDSSDTFKSSETVILVSLPIKTKALLLMTMWLGYSSTMTLWILPQQVLGTIGSVQAAAQLQISRCEDGMHWLDGCSRICIVGGYFSCTLEGWQMRDNLEFFGEVLGHFLVFLIFFITSFIFMHEGLCWEFTILEIIVEMFIFGKGIVAAIELHVCLLCNW